MHEYKHGCIKKYIYEFSKKKIEKKCEKLFQEEEKY
jgi:hypothetical protein